MAIERWRPSWGLSRGPFREMEEAFDQLMRGWGWPRWWRERGEWPAVDMLDRADEIVLKADVPGLEKKDLEVTLDNGVLTLKGERKEEKETKEKDYYWSERWAGSFVRSLRLPAGVDTEKIQATFKDGILEVHLPKTKETKGTKIDVKAA